MTEQGAIQLISSLGGTGLFAWVVYQLLSAHLRRMEGKWDRVGEAFEKVGERLTRIEERLPRGAGPAPVVVRDEATGRHFLMTPPTGVPTRRDR